MAINGMDTLGNQLEEARKKKGVTLREASEATKIRMEYLTQFESDEFDIALPPIYQRGFIKIYARYLGEDPAWYAAEIQARLNRKQAIQTKNDVRASLGQMDLASRRSRQAAAIGENEAAPIEDAPSSERERWSIPKLRMPKLRSTGSANEPAYDDFEESGEPLDRTFYLKVAVIVGSVTVAVVLLIALAKLILSSPDETPRNSGLADTPPSAEIVGPETTPSPPPANELIVRATGGDTYVQVMDSATEEVLGLFPLKAGQSRTVKADGEVVIRYTEGEFLEVERGGDTFAPSRSGTGKIKIQ